MELIEKREFKRVPVFIKVKTQTENLNYSFSYAKNISVGGMALESRVLLTPGLTVKNDTRLYLKFKLPNGQFYIETEAEVVRIMDENMIAVKFLNLDNRFAKDVDSFIDSCPNSTGNCN